MPRQMTYGEMVERIAFIKGQLQRYPGMSKAKYAKYEEELELLIATVDRIDRQRQQQQQN